MSQGLVYREDIDWLRAIAVLSVIAFHFQITAFHGGFIGVDVFFVISGFLIGSIIQTDVAAGTFSFALFYERRIRRLLPALYIVVAFTAIPAFYYLLLSERQAFFKSITATVTFTSNFLFWSQSGYFDRDAIEKPLLHTWSLSVEEQFYLLFPLLLWALDRFVRQRGVRFLVLVLIALASFGWTYHLMKSGRSATAFYMSPARAWEFLIGSVLASGYVPLPINQIARLAGRWSGVLLIIIPAFSLREGPGFPGLNAIAPCIGAALFIWAGIGATTVSRAKYAPANILRFFGQISYSLYLWHWPLFIFTRFAHDDLTLSAVEKVILFGWVTLLAYLSWAYVEQPFRRGSGLKTRSAISIIAASSACLIVIGLYGATVDGFPSNIDKEASRLNTFSTFDERSYGSPCFRFNDDPFNFEKCAKLDPTKTNVVLWGDSHAAHYFPGFRDMFKDTSTNIMLTAEAGCMPTFEPRKDDPERCKYFSGVIKSYFQDHIPQTVILSSHWLYFMREDRYRPMLRDLRNTIGFLTSRGIKVVVFGPSIQFKAALPDLLIRALSRGIKHLKSNDITIPDLFSGDNRLRNDLAAENTKFQYLSIVDILCPSKVCPLTVDDGVPLTWDYGHLTIAGSKFAASRIGPNLGLGFSSSENQYGAKER